MGVAHHASHVAWLEIGRTELLRDAHRTYAHLEEEGVFLVVTRVDLRYRRPVRYDDLVEIRTRVASTSRIKIRHEYEIALVERGDTDASRPLPLDGVLAVATSELACVDREGRPRALPDWLAGKG
jgi:acyl-CoA thioester hydrolase